MTVIPPSVDVLKIAVYEIECTCRDKRDPNCKRCVILDAQRAIRAEFKAKQDAAEAEEYGATVAQQAEAARVKREKQAKRDAVRLARAGNPVVTIHIGDEHHHVAVDALIDRDRVEALDAIDALVSFVSNTRVAKPGTKMHDLAQLEIGRLLSRLRALGALNDGTAPDPHDAPTYAPTYAAPTVRPSDSVMGLGSR